MGEVIPASLAGERLDRVVSLLTGCSRSVAATLVTEGRVRVAGTVVTSVKARIEAGDQVDVEAPAARGTAGPVADSSVDVRVVHADDDVIVVDKPPGLVVHPGAGNPHGTLVHGLLARFPELAAVGDPARPGIVHRLDKDTSGLLVVARSPVAYAALVADLAAHRVERRYLALVWGHLETPAGVVDAPVGRSGRTPTRMTVSARGKTARTHYSTRETFTSPVPATLLELRLETGRTHQIRVHLAAIGHPVIGDPTYGGRRGGITVPRPMLHAWSLRFVHPRSGDALAFEAPLPEDFVAVLGSLT